MQIITSPSKTQQFNGRKYCIFSLPRLYNKSKLLINLLKQIPPEDLAALLNTSDKLTQLTYRRIHGFTSTLTLQNAGQAIFTYQGDAYSAIAADRYSEEELHHAQKHLFILSALHGILRPLDLIQPYRLEMTSPLKLAESETLYHYWRHSVTKILNEELLKNDDRTLINLASAEYAKIIDNRKLQGTIVTISFKEMVRGKFRMIPIHSKRARSCMIHYIISNQISDPSRLKDFREGGYVFRPEESTEKEWLYCR